MYAGFDKKLKNQDREWIKSYLEGSVTNIWSTLMTALQQKLKIISTNGTAEVEFQGGTDIKKPACIF